MLGGILTSTAGWRAIFFLNLPAGVAALALLALRAPRSPRLAAPLDPAGQVTAVLGLAALTYGVIAGGSGGFARPQALTALAVALLAGGAFLAVESRAARPMVPLALSRSPAVVTCVVTGFSVNAAFYGVAFLLSLYFQRVLGLQAITAGLLFLPMTGLLTLSNLLSARVAARWGHHVPVRAGLCVGTLGMLLLALLRGRTGLEIALVPAGAGLGFALPSLTFLLLDSLPASQAGLAGGLFNAGRADGRCAGGGGLRDAGVGLVPGRPARQHADLRGAAARQHRRRVRRVPRPPGELPGGTPAACPGEKSP